MSTLNELFKRLEIFSTLEKDWDDDGAETINSNVINTVKEFLTTLYNQTTLLYHPEINPCPDGSIDMSWHTDNQQLLINFKKDGETIGYYGENKNNNTTIKNTIIKNSIGVELLPWMKWVYI